MEVRSILSSSQDSNSNRVSDIFPETLSFLVENFVNRIFQQNENSLYFVGTRTTNIPLNGRCVETFAEEKIVGGDERSKPSVDALSRA